MKYIVLLLILVQTSLSAQNPGPRFSAMGSGGVAVADIWSLQQNPAGLAALKSPALAISIKQHFLDRELSTKTALLALPYRRNVAGFSFESYGFDEYSEQSIGFNYAKAFGESFRLAVGLKYYQLSITQYGSAKAYSVEAGLQIRLTDKFTLASHVVNPNGSEYKSVSHANIPVKLSFGCSYIVNDRILMVADIRKLLNYPVDVMTGMEFAIVKWFSLRGGISANPFKQYTGFGISSKRLGLDFSVESHHSLGYSPQLGLGYEL